MRLWRLASWTRLRDELRLALRRVNPLFLEDLSQFFPIKKIFFWSLYRGLRGKESTYNAGDTASIPGSERCPERSKWQPTPVFLPGKSHGQRSLAGYSPWCCKRVRHDLATKQQQIWFIYNVVLLSAIQQSESAIHIASLFLDSFLI